MMNVVILVISLAAVCSAVTDSSLRSAQDAREIDAAIATAYDALRQPMRRRGRKDRGNDHEQPEHEQLI
jgi:hypothetical protein